MIYADNASTTKVSDTVLEKMLPFLREEYGNASSQYSFGIKAKHAIEEARNRVACAIGASSNEVFFTSGGSESNSWLLSSVTCGHVITSSIEHSSVLNSCLALERKGIYVTYLPVNHDGMIALSDIKAAIRPDTKLVSIMLANNEIGTIQPIAEIGQFLHTHHIPFHTDAVQAVGHLPIDVVDLNVDFLSASAHKFNGPKGVGILYKKQGITLPPLVYGGRQESMQRAGTENVAGIVGTGIAIEESVGLIAREGPKLTSMVSATINGIISVYPNVIINGSCVNRLPGILSLTFEGVSGESIMQIMDLKGICVTTSSACTSGISEPSHVLVAIGHASDQAKSTIRISYGRYNKKSDVSKVVDGLTFAIAKIKSR